MEKRKDARQQEVVYEFTPDTSAQSKVPNGLSTHHKEVHREVGLDERNAPDPRTTQEAFARREAAAESRRNFESLGSGQVYFETPEDRLSKLKFEVSELARDVEVSLARNSGKASEVLGAHPHDMAAELKTLQQRLIALSKEGQAPSGSGTDKALGSTPGPMAIPGSLSSQLETFALGAALDSVPSDAQNITYEINYVPNVRGVVDSTKVAALESTLADIEKCLGVPLSGTHYVDLHSAVSELHSRMSLLDSSKMDAINQRVKTIMVDVEKLLEKKTELENRSRNDEIDQKVSELYAFCQRWHSTSAQLPNIIARLRSLQILHEQSASFATRLTALEEQQDEILKLLETTNTAVAELGGGLQQNMTTMRDNMKVLEEKMAKAMGGR